MKKPIKQKITALQKKIRQLKSVPPFFSLPTDLTVTLDGSRTSLQEFRFHGHWKTVRIDGQPPGRVVGTLHFHAECLDTVYDRVHAVHDRIHTVFGDRT